VRTESYMRPTILLAEDEDVYRHLIAAVLRKEGYDILIAKNGREALERAKRCGRRIHLLLTDVTMPEVDGRDLAKYLQATWSNLRVIIMSARPAATLRLEQGWTFLGKPFVPNALIRRIREALPSLPNKTMAGDSYLPIARR